MKNARSRIRAVCLVVAACLPLSALAQVSVYPNLDHDRMLASADPALRANKRLVYDFWREVFESGHTASVGKYLAESYIQHNPYVPSGRAAFVEFLTRRVPGPKPIEQRIKSPLVAIIAEGNLVTLSFVRELPDPKDPTKKYTTTWFDMFRIQDGKIAEHWDPAVKQ